MAETVSGCVLLAVSAIGMFIVVYIRLFGSREYGNWRKGGGKISFTGQLAIWIFLGSGGACILFRSAIWVIPAIVAWLVGYISQNREGRRHQMEEEALRKKNSLEHPGIFDHTPPKDLTAVADEQLRLYDAGACTFLGIVNKSDLQTFVDTFFEKHERDQNDIFVLIESLDMLPKAQITLEFLELLQNAFKHRDYLVLRWMPHHHNPLVGPH
jgi:hypothetical protein